MTTVPWVIIPAAVVAEFAECAALLNYRNGWHALAACHINPDDPRERMHLALAVVNMASLFPTIENRAFAVTVGKMCSDASGGATWLN